MKKEVEAFRIIFDIDPLFNNNSSLNEIIESLNSRYMGYFNYAEAAVGHALTSHKFQTIYGCGGAFDLIDVILVFYRMETDEEYNERLVMEEVRKDTLEKKRLDKEKKERAEYERLKKKFGEM